MISWVGFVFDLSCVCFSLLFPHFSYSDCDIKYSPELGLFFSFQFPHFSYSDWVCFSLFSFLVTLILFVTVSFSFHFPHFSDSDGDIPLILMVWWWLWHFSSNFVYIFWKYMWVKKCMKIHVMLFKNRKLLFKTSYQTALCVFSWVGFVFYRSCVCFSLFSFLISLILIVTVFSLFTFLISLILMVTFSVRLTWLILPTYFCYYLWVTLHFLVLFMSLTILFQLTFTFIYSIFSFSKISGFQTDPKYSIFLKPIEITTCHNHLLTIDAYYFYPIWT